jgi:nitroreductase
MATPEKPLSQVIRERRATPQFDSAPVPDSDLRRILRAGLEAPSGFNLQPWRFIVVRDQEQRRRLRAAAHNQSKVEEAPVVIVCCGDAEAWQGPALDEVMQISAEHGHGDTSTQPAVRKKITEAFAGHPDIGMWLNRQVMIAFTHMMLMAEALGYDTAPMEGFWEDKVKALLEIPESVRVVSLLGLGRLRGNDKRYGGRLPMERTVFAERWGETFAL